MKLETLEKAIKIDKEIKRIKTILEKLMDKETDMLIGYAVPIHFAQTGENQWVINNEERKLLIDHYQNKKEKLEKELEEL